MAPIWQTAVHVVLQHENNRCGRLGMNSAEHRYKAENVTGSPDDALATVALQQSISAGLIEGSGKPM